MKIESEKLLEAKLSKKIKEAGGLSLKLLSTHVTGLPDRMCLLPGGKILFAEIKTTGKKPTQRQLLVHSKLRSLGFRVEVIDSSKQIEDLL